jgi:hypothetical protein
VERATKRIQNNGTSKTQHGTETKSKKREKVVIDCGEKFAPKIQ